MKQLFKVSSFGAQAFVVHPYIGSTWRRLSAESVVRESNGGGIFCLFLRVN